jgi:hypothetical protein
MKPNKGKGIRKRLSQEEANLVDDYRTLRKECEESGTKLEDVKHGWLKTETASLFFKNPLYKDETAQEFETLRSEILNKFKEFAPTYPQVKRKKSKDDHLLVISPADVHIGKLCTAFETGEEYNQQIAVKRVLEGVQGILDKTSGYNFDKILLIIGNDILHTDTPRRTTTSGTPQDTDGMWYENFLTAVRLYVDVINILTQVADVQVQYNPSNHDYANGFFLAQLLEAHFNNSKNVSFNVSISHRKYFVYGLNLIGSTHGDGAKIQDLPLLMAHEAKQWSITKHRYIYTHHLHHKTSKDIMSVCVEALRSPSGTDSWHHRNGYQFAPKAIEGFIHHKDFGQISRITHIF